jgi:hypothetical protein
MKGKEAFRKEELKREAFGSKIFLPITKRVC